MSRGDRIRQMLASGLTIRDVAQALGVSTNTVAYHRDRPMAEPRVVPDLRASVDQVRTHEAVAELRAQGLSYTDIARRLQVSKSTVAYHARRLGQPRDERGARRYDWAAIQAFYDRGHTKQECEQAFGFSSHSWHEATKRGDIVVRPRRVPDEELFVIGGKHSRFHIKARLIEGGYVDLACAVCQLTKWCGLPITLALHHINGNRRDNRLPNLQLLCPNCHSQTHNYAGRNRRDLPLAA